MFIWLVSLSAAQFASRLSWKALQVGDKLPRRARSGRVLVAPATGERREMGRMISVFRD